MCFTYICVASMMKLSLNTHSHSPTCSKHNFFSFPTPFSFKLLVCFLAHLAKGNGSFCHHLASVVCRPLTFHMFFSSETPQPNELTLGRKYL